MIPYIGHILQNGIAVHVFLFMWFGLVWFGFVIGSFYSHPDCPATQSVDQVDLKLTEICLLLPPEFWD